jgi:hypothetical protein
MTNKHNLNEFLGEPRRGVISTWDIVITPSLALSLVQAKTKAPEPKTSDPVDVVKVDKNTAYVVGGFAALQASLQDDQERFISVSAYEPPYESAFDLPCGLDRALDGYMRFRLQTDPFIWSYLNHFDATDWEIALQLNEPLRPVKQARQLRDGLSCRNLEVPTSYEAALDLAAHHVPEVFTHSLATTL